MLSEYYPEKNRDATQRILGVYAWKVHDEEQATEQAEGLHRKFGRHRIVVGNTMGEFAGFELTEGPAEHPAPFKQGAKFSTRGHLEPLFTVSGERPVRCMSGVRVGDSVLAVLGRTDGSIQVWQLAAAASKSATEPHLIFGCQVHRNGVNAVRVAKSQDGKTITLASGGDDQALGLIRLCVSTAQPEFCHVVENAAASAIRGIFTDGSTVWAADLNQRLRTWKLADACSGADANASAIQRLWLPKDTNSITSGINTTILSDEVMTEVAEGHGLDVDISSKQVAVVGCGLQVFNLV
jgi:hypothetical protein